jgi:hypothetical protein
MVCAVIAAEFSGRMAHARDALPRDQVAGAISKLKAECRAAITAAQDEGKALMYCRMEAAKILYGRKRPRPTGSGSPSSADLPHTGPR